MPDLNRKLRALYSDYPWDDNSTGAPPLIIADLDVTDDLMDVWAATGGYAIKLKNGAEIFDIEEAVEINEECQSANWQMDRCLIIGCDSGDGWFILDSKNVLGTGTGSIWWIERDILGPDKDAFPAARSLRDFVLSTERDDRFDAVESS